MVFPLAPSAQRSALLPAIRGVRFARAACLAGAATAFFALGCQNILGIHEVSRDGDGGAASGEGGSGSGGRPGHGGGGTGGEGGTAQEGFSIALDPAAARVVRGSSAELTVTVARSGDFAGDV